MSPGGPCVPSRAERPRLWPPVCPRGPEPDGGPRGGQAGAAMAAGQPRRSAPRWPVRRVAYVAGRRGQPPGAWPTMPCRAAHLRGHPSQSGAPAGRASPRAGPAGAHLGPAGPSISGIRALGTHTSVSVCPAPRCCVAAPARPTAAHSGGVRADSSFRSGCRLPRPARPRGLLSADNTDVTRTEQKPGKNRRRGRASASVRAVLFTPHLLWRRPCRPLLAAPPEYPGQHARLAKCYSTKPKGGE